MTIFANISAIPGSFCGGQEEKWAQNGSIPFQFYLPCVTCSMKLLLSNSALASRNAKLPYLAWCYRDTSSKRSQGQHWAMYAYRSVIVTSDARALTSSLTKTCVNWTTAPRKRGLKTSFPTLADITLDETGEEVGFLQLGKKPTSYQGFDKLTYCSQGSHLLIRWCSVLW